MESKTEMESTPVATEMESTAITEMESTTGMEPELPTPLPTFPPTQLLLPVEKENAVVISLMGYTIETVWGLYRMLNLDTEYHACTE
jgi:hypothetical protein